MGRNINTKLLLVIFAILSSGLFHGCTRNIEITQPETGALHPIPGTATILFTSNQDAGTNRWEIYTMDTQGDNITRITNTKENHYLIGIDSSQRYIVATRGTEEKKRLWLLDLVADTQIPLTNANNHAEGRTFSPDGEWIVFWMLVSGESYSDIYKIRRDGTDLTNLTNTPLAHEFDPAWSKSGNEIAFNYNNGSPNRFVLKAMDTNGGNVRTIYDATDSVATAIFPAGVYDPSWGPNDEWILVEKPVQFTGNGENGGAGIWCILKVRTDGSEVVDLTSAGAQAQSAVYLPSFSSDGNFIVFTSRYGFEDPTNVSLNIFKMDKDGGSLEALTSTNYWEQFAIWIK